MTSDLDLLGQYARKNLQDAFTEIVRRHVDLVYSAALRQVRSPQLAEEVTQSVFTDLARSAGNLKPDTNLTAWLYSVTRRTAIDAIRKESRRQLREQIAGEMNDMNATADWTHIEPLLDEAMAALDETDRAAILLRYFENKNLREVGESLRISDDAAQKRVSRAVERLREFFSKRKVTIGAGGLAVLISTNAVQAAPAGLAAAISAAAVLAGTTVSASAAIVAAKTIAMTTLQKSIIGATLAAVVGTGIFEAHQTSQLSSQVQTLQQKQAPLTEQIRQLQSALNDATNQLAGLLAENEQLKSNSNETELPKLRGEVGVLRAQLASAAKPDLTAFPSSQAINDGSNQAMLDYLGHPAPPPPNLNAAYSKEGLINALQNAAQTANITLKRVEIDDSEFPFLIGVEVQTGNDIQKLQDQIKTMGEYNYTGGISGGRYFVGNIIPYDQYPAEEKHDILNRLGLRETMFYDKVSGVLP